MEHRSYQILKRECRFSRCSYTLINKSNGVVYALKYQVLNIYYFMFHIKFVSLFF